VRAAAAAFAGERECYAARSVPAEDLAIVVVGPAAELKTPLAELGPVTVRKAPSIISGEP